jgi:hypothetical protein
MAILSSTAARTIRTRAGVGIGMERSETIRIVRHPERTAAVALEDKLGRSGDICGRENWPWEREWNRSALDT